MLLSRIYFYMWGVALIENKSDYAQEVALAGPLTAALTLKAAPWPCFP